ncbi:MAG: spore coat protein U domain-containing protein [Rhizomicrobium sp.]
MNNKNLGLLGAVSVSALLLVGGAANAANTITLTGTVPQMCSLAVNAVAGGTGIALETSATALAVGSVDETCNDDAGYTVAMVTTNGTTSGLLKSTAGTDDAAHALSYTVKYDGVAAIPVAGTVDVTDVSAPVSGSGTVTKPITIGYTGATAANSAAGDYTDTLTFAMTAK